jgi:hypothetical protein
VQDLSLRARARTRISFFFTSRSICLILSSSFPCIFFLRGWFNDGGIAQPHQRPAWQTSLSAPSSPQTLPSPPSLMDRGPHSLTPSFRLCASSSSHIPTQTHSGDTSVTSNHHAPACLPFSVSGVTESTRRWAGVLCATSWTEFLTGSAHTCRIHGSCVGGWVMGVSCAVWVGVMCRSAM